MRSTEGNATDSRARKLPAWLREHLGTATSTGRLGVLFLLLALVVLGSAFLDYLTARRELTRQSKEHALALVAVIQQSGSNALMAMAAMENLVQERLFTVARFIGHRVSELPRPEARRTLGTIAARESLDVVVVWKEQKPWIIWPDHVPPQWLHPDSALATCFADPACVLSDGVLGPEGPWYRVALSAPGGLVVAIGYDARRLLALRREIGVGNLIRSLAQMGDIEYIALQDTVGILAATPNVRSLSRIVADSLLLHSLRTGDSVWRQAWFAGEKVFEAVQPFNLGGGERGLLRVGVSRHALELAQRRLLVRVALSSLLLLFAGSVLFAFVWASQQAAETRRAYHRVQSLSSGILERMADGVLAVDRQGTVQWMNAAAAQILGQTEGEIQGLDVRSVAPVLAEILDRAVKQGKPIPETEQTCTVAGKERVLAVSASVLLDENGEVETAFAVFRDLTERRRLEKRLAQERRLSAMGELASGVAHEIRNPLNAIAVIAQRFAREFEPRESADEYHRLAKTVVSETRRINDIIQQFLKFARPPKLNLREADLATIVREVVDLFSSTAKEKGVILELEAPQTLSGRVDPEQLKQALGNLVQNAIQACSPGDRVTVRLRREGQDIVIQVQDTGPGIPENVRPKIFDLYFTTRPDGTGIGLSLVHRIISAHSGTIELSTEEGKGTEFVVRIPANSEVSDHA
ncbi:MAG: PAS domain-containing protein [Calditrichaeota bacterium]|nr:PAS domain-containing protein [Calditrichota bacterium]